MYKKIKEFYKENKKSSLICYLVLRALVIICMIFQITHQNYENVALCFFTLILFTFPYVINKRLKITIPDTLEIIIYLFIFSAEILGEIQNFYGSYPHWDTILHTLNGFLCAAVGFSLIDLLNRSEKVKLKLSPLFLTVVSFCFSMTIGVLWEFFEFGADTLFSKDMQKDRVVEKISTVKLHPDGENIPIIVDDIKYTIIYSGEELKEIKIENGYLDIGIIDTMKDLIVNFIGALVFSIFGYLYIHNRDKYKFVEGFLPRKRRE